MSDMAIGALLGLAGYQVVCAILTTFQLGETVTYQMSLVAVHLALAIVFGAIGVSMMVVA